MSNLDKLTTVLGIAVLMCLSMLMVESAFAQVTPKPAVPEFTFSVADHSYEVEATTATTVDPYDDGISNTTTSGYHRVNGSITLRIKNQSFMPYYNSEGYPVKLYYCVRVRGIDTGYWNYFPDYEAYFPATNSTYTQFVIGYSGNCFQTSGGYNNFRPDGTLDFQVKAFIGYMNVTYVYSGSPVIRSSDLRTAYVGETSDWSSIQTVTLPNASYTPVTPNPNPTSPTTSPTPTTTTYNPTTTPTTSSPSPSENNRQQEKDTTQSAAPLTTVLLIITVLICIAATSLILIVRKN
ncbi:MAG: hypothetical protein ACQCN4_13295 [Candidatus Bathyarchaeia archaeon]|jgi:hypothetical protein